MFPFNLVISKLRLRGGADGLKAGLMVLLVCVGVAFAADADGMAVDNPGEINAVVFFVSFFLLSTAIATFAVVAGVGGGVIFTPLLLGFTEIDSYIIRATGLFVALVGALVAARPFLKRGIANMRLILWSATPYAVFCVVGAVLAVHVKETCGLRGEAILRGVLGLIVISIGFLFLAGGRKMAYPEVTNVSDFTRSLGLGMTYWEDSLVKTVHYEVKRAGAALVLFGVAGLISGFFGMGAGWAMVPIFNLFMLAPLKVAAVCARLLMGVGGTAAMWSYLRNGGLVPLFVVPCMLGAVVGSLVGTRIMLKIKAGVVRHLVVVVMFFAGLRLLIKAASMWQGC